MKTIKLIIMLSIISSASSFAAEQITREAAASYTKVGDVSIKQEGVPEVGGSYLSDAANQKCDESSVKPEDCFYLIVATPGKKTNHKEINLEVFKK